MATPTPRPSPTEQATEVPAASGSVRITYINYDGRVYRVESDEYAVIKNMGRSPTNLAGWRPNADDASQGFCFPDLMLEPGQECRVYTNQYRHE